VCRAPAPPLTYTLSLHDALPIYFVSGCPGGHPHRLLGYTMVAGHRRYPPDGRLHGRQCRAAVCRTPRCAVATLGGDRRTYGFGRSEEHTSELQSRENLVCRLLLE